MKRESKLEPARLEDGPDLLELMEAQAAVGDLALLYTRRPDPVASIRSESPRVSLGVLRDEAGRVRFMESCVERRVWLEGEARILPYVGNVRRQTGALPGVNWLRALCDEEGARYSLGFCSILEGNEAAARVFCRERKGRPYAPRLSPLCGYRTALFSPGAVKGRAGEGFFRMGPEDREELLAFLRQEGRRWTLFPAVEDLEREFYGLRVEDFYGLRRAGALAACAALWDQRPFRQYVVKAYKGPYAFASRHPLLVRLLGYFPLPPCGETADVRVLALPCAREDALFPILLAGLAQAARERGIPILAAGGAESHPWRTALSSLRSIGFDSTIYTVEMPGNTLPPPAAGAPPHVELGWL